MNARMGWMMGLGLLMAGHAYAATGIVEFKGTEPDSRLTGKMTFAEEKKGVVVTGTLSKAPAGKHGIHIRQNSSCADPGGHLDYSKNPHGYAPKDYPLHSHPGDMGNIEVDVDGNATFKVHMPELGLANKARYNIRRRAVVITEKEDDFSQPDGNGGKAIACGVIEER